MRLPRRAERTGTGLGRFWPVLLILLAAVLVPAACVVWFMTEAMANEALAVRQRLRDVYCEKISAARKMLDGDFDRRLTRLAEGKDLPPCQRFFLLANESGADAVIICDKSGRPLYPDGPGQAIKDPLTEDPTWRAAVDLEERIGDLSSAAAAYAEVAQQTTDAAGKARALRAEARCLMQLGKQAEASAVLDSILADENLREAADAAGRLIGPSAQLLKLQLLRASGGRDNSTFRAIAGRLRQRLEDYRGKLIPSGQRRFLLRALEEVLPSGQTSSILAAEETSAEYLHSEQSRAEPAALTPTRTAGLWHVATPDRSVVALYRLDPLLQYWQELIRPQGTGGCVLQLLPPQAEQAGPEPFVSSAVGERLPGWSLQVQLTGADPLSAAESRKAAYLWTGGAGIVLIAVLAAAVAGLLGRQMRLTRLKNDLIATVSHELKTPLASMRMLVDTLLEGRYRDAGQVREYLQLIAGQNVRLSRLIDNFLTFSRMERNKRAFEFAPLRVEDIVAAAVEAAQERFSGPGCTLQVQIQSDLPSITGDRDALTTVLLNLLDNAHKYTGDTKCVTVRGSLQDGQIVLSVADNGIGIPRRALRRIFDRFYQVDQSLSRRAGGCGLGLSIVQFIVAAHGGTVTVTSEPGKGSCFSVRLPANV